MIPKPLLVKRRDFADDVATLIQTSNLPAFAMIDILEHALEILRQMNMAEEQEAVAEYQRRIAQNANNKETRENPVQAQDT